MAPNPTSGMIESEVPDEAILSGRQTSFSGVAHVKVDPFQVGQLWASLGK